MKDLKHYFTDTSKPCDPDNDDKEVTNEPGATATAIDDDAASLQSPNATNSRKKRGRVKIKISQNNSNVKICNIVDSNSDMVDKTPSPFADANGKGEDQDDTPKRSTSQPRKSNKNILAKAAAKRLAERSDVEAERSDDKDDEICGESIETGEAKIAVGVDESRNDANGEQSTTTEREESNAFQVLMTRKKTVQYNGSVATSNVELDDEAAAKAAEEHRTKLKRNREKLVVMADKKGYSKRKLEESEEAEKIERRLEKRAKVFKQMGKKDGIDKNPGRRVSPGSLHDYFSKPSVEQKDGAAMAVSGLAGELEAVREVEATQEAQTAARSDNPEIAQKRADDAQAMVESSNQLSAQSQSDQRRAKKPKWSLRINLTGNDELPKDSSNTLDEKTTPNGKREIRPRRSKAKTTNYEDNESSDNDATDPKIHSKKKKSTSNSQKNKNAKKIDLPSLPIESSDKSSTESKSTTSPDVEVIDTKIVKRQTNEKLAPLFVKRSKPDQATLEARRLFLHSIPERMENSRQEKKIVTVGSPVLPFPTISHVTQSKVSSNFQIDDGKIKFPIRENHIFTPSYDLDDFKSVTSLNDEIASKNVNAMEFSKDNLNDVLADIESRCSDAREIWKRVSTTAARPDNDEETTSRISPKRKHKKRKSNDKKMDNSDEIGSEGCTWTRKYRPLSTSEIVGNEEAAEKLRKWLEAWKAPLRRDDENTSSGDEFYSSDCSYASNFDNNQVAVLLGPHGCGKTASVYAVAEELGYSILEINASSKRAGKKILKDLEEATKSHRIKKPGCLSLVPSLNVKKSVTKNSLILVEDVDLIFDEDEGFISATCQLASNTKRPIVMTVRDTCSHLNRMAPQQQRIYYQTTVGSRVSALLELITLAESGYRLPGPCLDRLLLGGDLRKALLQLQYLLLSGPPRACEVPTNFHKSLWQDMRYCVYKPAIKATKKSSKKKLIDEATNKTTLENEQRAVLRTLALNLDRLSFLSTLIAIEDPLIEISTLKIEPSLSLDQSTHCYTSACNTSREIAKWLRDRSMIGKQAIDNSSQMSRQLTLKKELNLGINFALSQVSPMILDGRALTMDYLPIVREICRSEEIRITTNNKRGNRFFHYLQSLKLPSTSTRPNILSAACKIMRDNVKSDS